MDSKARRTLLIGKLTGASEPLTGGTLALSLGVSRQVIVGDIAILRAAGVSILATPQGYLLPNVSTVATLTAKLACHHGLDHLQEELAIIIDNGGKVLDVIVEHPLYGEIRANLMLASRRDLANFMDNLSQCGASPLSVVTDGIHLHTIEAPSQAVLNQIQYELKMAGILLK